MGKTVIQMSLSQSSIRNAISQIERYRQSLEYKVNEFARRLALLGVNIAKENIVDYDATFKYELYDSIHSVELAPNIYYVVAGTDHCAFVEFGTGIKGVETPYKGNLPIGVSWNPNTGATIHDLPDGRHGWFYPGDDGQWHFTEGMPSRPFMFETSLTLQQAKVIRLVALEVFGNG